MVDDFACDDVEVKHIVSVVNVGDAEVGFQIRVFVKVELAFDINVEAVVGGETASVEFSVKDSQLSVGRGVVEIDTVLEGVVFVIALDLSEWEARTEVPSSAEFPLTLVACSVGKDDVDVVTAVEMWLIGGEEECVTFHFFVVPVDETKGVDGPDVPILVFVFH